MALDYRYRFEKYGQLIPSSGVSEREVWLDVGNSLGMGCFDHHQGQSGYHSTLEALLENLQYLANLKKSVEDQKEIVVHLHRGPDMDCVASWYVVRYFLEHEGTEFDALFGKDGTVRQKLLKYVSDIDEGKGKHVKVPTLYALFSLLAMNKEEKIKEKDRYVVEKGLELISLAVGLLEGDKENNIDLSKYDFSDSKLFKSEEIHIIKDSLDKYSNEYIEEKNNSDISFEKIAIWKKTKGSNDYKLEEVDAAIWEKVSENPFGYLYAREEGNLVTIVPYSIKGRNGDETTRFFASVNTDIDNNYDYSLKPIVEIIEQMEQMEEQRYYDQTGRYRRDHSQPRKDKSHLDEAPFSATSDPWYFSPEEDLFDAPRDQSILDYNDILEVIRHKGSNVKKSYVLSIGCDREPQIIYRKGEQNDVALSRWQQDVCKLISSDTDFKIVFAELDSSLARHSNQILKAYCMNLTGRSFHECNESQFLFLDYRTCIYADLNCVIILVATHGDDSYSGLPIASILSVEPSKSSEDSATFIKDIVKVLKQRSDLLEYGEKIGKTKISDRKTIEKLNDSLIEFSAQVQEDEVIHDHLERKVYFFLKDEFEIDRLKSSVIEEINILVNESRNRLVSKLNVLSSLAVPFILIATLFQMGIFRFEEMFILSGVWACIGWGIVILLGVVLAIILKGSTKKTDRKS